MEKTQKPNPQEAQGLAPDAANAPSKAGKAGAFKSSLATSAKSAKTDEAKTKAASRKAARAAHHCHAIDCHSHCAPERLMCPAHWRMVPLALQRAVWASYRHGQCDDKRPSGVWLDAAKAAIEAVAKKEGKEAMFNAWTDRQRKLAELLAGAVRAAREAAAAGREAEAACASDPESQKDEPFAGKTSAQSGNAQSAPTQISGAEKTA
jgi:hypothetical protein